MEKNKQIMEEKERSNQERIRTRREKKNCKYVRTQEIGTKQAEMKGKKETSTSEEWEIFSKPHYAAEISS